MGTAPPDGDVEPAGRPSPARRRTARSQATVKLLEALGSELMVHQPIDATAVATATKLSVRDVAPGAITAAVIWQMLQLFGTAYVANVVKDAGLTYGVFAVVLGLLAWIFQAALGVVRSVAAPSVAVCFTCPTASVADSFRCSATSWPTPSAAA